MQDIDKNVSQQPIGKENGIYFSVFGEDSAPIAQPITKSPVVKKNPIYQMKEFDEKSYWDQIKSIMFNTDKEKKDQRRFNRYMKSKQGQAALERARAAHLANERTKHSQALLKEADAVWQEHIKKQQPFQVPTLKNATPIPVVKKAQPVINPIKRKTNEEWLQIAKQHGFNSLQEVKDWQRANNLKLIDGKFGPESFAKYKELKASQPPQNQSQIDQNIPTNVTPGYYYTDESGNYFIYDNNKLTQITPDKTQGLENKGLLRDMKDFKNAVDFLKKTVSFGGLEFSNPYYLDDAFRTTNNAPDWNQSGQGKGAFVRVNGHNGVYPLRVWNDRSFAIDTKNKRAYELEEDLLGEVDGRGNDKVLGIYDLYSFFNKDPKEQTQIKNQKFGGTMNKINYFQQGGAAPKQQDMQQQLIALVQAAMQGDQKATNAINQILEAAKAGDQQAAQLAQMIQQIAKKMQGQATTAKWGAKLSYIRSLKYTNGGKACPTCQAGAPIKPVKKVEEKACGGKAKRAKKRYFGGWL